MKFYLSSEEGLRKQKLKEKYLKRMANKSRGAEEKVARERNRSEIERQAQAERAQLHRKIEAEGPRKIWNTPEERAAVLRKGYLKRIAKRLKK